MSKIKRFFTINQSLLLSILSFLILSFAAYRYTIYKKGLWEKDIRSDILEVLVGKKSNLEKALYSRIYFTRGVAGYVSLNPNLTNDEFYTLAVEYIKSDSVISSMALSKNCILSNIYPLEGHEEAIGLNLLEHPERKEIVEKTIETHETFVAGPVELVEGGIAFISYTPVFDKTTADDEFWGVCDIVILRDKLLNEANIFRIENETEYALKGYNGTGDKGEVFWGSPEVFEKEPVSVEIDLPYGNWILAATTTKGWEHFADQDRVLTIILFLCVFIISTLIWLFANAIVKLRRSEKNLREANATKDKLFSIIAHDLKNPLGSFIGLSEVVVQNYDVLPDEKKKSIFTTILDTAENVFTLLENLLFWAKSQQNSLQYNPEMKQVSPMLEEIYQTFISSAKLKRINFTKNVKEDSAAFMDENLTKTIVRNLVSNSIKFTQDGGDVNISCKNEKVDNKTFLSISISDTGIGMKPEKIEEIYQSNRLVSTLGTNNERGTGLGLVLAQEFAIKQGGKLIIESTPGKGSVFSLLLPIEEKKL